MSGKKRGPARRPIAERFWPKVRKTRGCWHWEGSKGKNSCQFRVMTPDGPVTKEATHVSLFLENGAWPGEGGDSYTRVWRDCGTPFCVRPDHLRIVSAEEFGRLSGDLRRGKPIPAQQRLTPAAVRAARRVYERGDGSFPKHAKKTAEKYGVSYGAVYAAVRGYSWNHVD